MQAYGQPGTLRRKSARRAARVGVAAAVAPIKPRAPRKPLRMDLMAKALRRRKQVAVPYLGMR